MYRYIADAEMEIFRHYKVMIHGDEKYMTMLDLQAFLQRLIKETKDEEKQRNNGGNNMMKSLFAIGDMINYMRYRDTNIR
jgi:hypothetical protein